ncbi:hypothetical protein L228DRAFT_261027 [Xylona heveae TC161]|uniref:Uncharacterized protein n=1 Tax=Xylona heveae (strain CBS 132557 / TC161) TaxID=1328760 RepID=A0A165H2T0_XYLHT|nr:hypothetical protein L228DRAFT_261027 [Xylona heveae TC161]KZF22906.1 hypothetical protein L228DRAFT_261027 [Xylona heveae TC161]
MDCQSWPVNDIFLSKFNYLFLQDHDALELNGANLGDLTNDIHPLFSRENFLVFDEKYQVLMPTLRLASRILTDMSSITFFHALIYGRNDILGGGMTETYGRPCFTFNRQETPLTPLQFKDTFDTLENLASFVKFRTNPLLTTMNSWGCTSGNADIVHPMGGLGSYIDINPIFLYHLGSGRLSVSERLRIQLILAITLCHECTHAIGFAAYPRDPDEIGAAIVEPFFENHRLAELGSAFEDFVFGGIIDPMAEQTDCCYGLIIEGWPGNRVPVTREGAVPVPVRTDIPVPAFSTRYLIPMTWVQAVHSTAFWDDVARLKETSLKAPTTTGYRFVNSDSGHIYEEGYVLE